MVHLWMQFVEKIQTRIFITYPTNTIIVCKWWKHFKSIGYKVLLSYSSTILTPSSRPKKENIRWKLLNLGSTIKDNMLWTSFFSNFLTKERKKSKTQHTFLLMLEANKDNAKVIPKSSSIKLSRVDGFRIFPLNFKHIVMANCNASESN